MQLLNDDKAFKENMNSLMFLSILLVIDSSLEKYLKALDLNQEKSNLYSAILDFKIAKSYLKKENLSKASFHIDSAIKSNFKNQNLLKKINKLKGKIDQELLRKK